MYVSRFCIVLVIAVLPLGVLSGCNRNAVKWIEIQGTVAVDGVPIERGVIQFDNDGGNGPSGGGKIDSGRFKARVVAGPSVVRVSGESRSDKPVPDPVNVGQFVDFVPATDQAQHWNDSDYTVEITDPKNTYDIDLPAIKK